MLLALLAVVCAPIFSRAAAAGEIPEGMIYCPLSKKLQPISPPEEVKPLFGDICASPQTKDRLVREILLDNSFRTLSLNRRALDELAFDFLAYGKTAFEKVPNLPDSPPEKLVRHHGTTVSGSANDEHKAVWKQAVKVFLREISPRPPTVQDATFYTVKKAFQSAELSRRLAPRAPPVRS